MFPAERYLNVLFTAPVYVNEQPAIRASIGTGRGAKRGARHRPLLTALLMSGPRNQKADPGKLSAPATGWKEIVTT